MKAISSVSSPGSNPATREITVWWSPGTPARSALLRGGMAVTGTGAPRGVADAGPAGARLAAGAAGGRAGVGGAGRDAPPRGGAGPPRPPPGPGRPLAPPAPPRPPAAPAG